MGPSPPAPPSSSQLPPSRPLPHFLSPVSDLTLLLNSDRDTEVLTQALTRELSSGNGVLSPSSVLPSASCFSACNPQQTFSNSLEGRPWRSQSSQPPLAAKTLQQQQQNAYHQHHQEGPQQHHHHHHHHHQQQQKQQPQQHQQPVVPAASMRFPADVYSQLDQTSLQNGSPLSINSSPRPVSISTETPSSPFSTISTNSAISTIARDQKLFEYFHSQHQDSHPQAMASSYKPSEISSVYSASQITARAASMGFSSQATVGSASMGLSSQAAGGAGASKVSKKRSRAANKAPITVVPANTANFRALVQQLTGIPSSPYPHTGTQLFKPLPIRHNPLTSTLTLPTLDTSAGFLGPQYLKEGFSFPDMKRHQGLPTSSVSPFTGRRVDGFDLQHQIASYNKQSIVGEQGTGIDHGLPSLPSGLATSLWNATDNLKARANPSSTHEGEQISQISAMGNPTPTPSPSPSDSLPPDEYLASKSSFNAVDSWLSFDAPTMELIRMA